MGQGSSESVRAMAVERYVKPALHSGKTEFTIAVKDLMEDLVAQGFPPGNTPQVCTALRKKAFLRENGLEIEKIDGPRSKMSTTVVVRYRVTTPTAPSSASQRPAKMDAAGTEETPEARALRLTEKLRGLLKEELAEYGGGEAFLRWVRGYDEEDAA
jgi:hypothetical protein